MSTYFSLLFIFILSFSLESNAQKADSVYQGIASYYHLKFNGRKTSSGERFNNDSLTAAHKFLPFGTNVKVTNLNTKDFVIVRVNDRLPQKSKRTIDLTQEAARRLGIIRKGLQKVELSVIQ
jgi:rare lipoprotein A